MKTAKPLSALLGKTLGILATAAAMLPLCLPALAQDAATVADPLLTNPQGGDNSSSDPFSSNGSGQMNSVFDIIHRATLGSFRTDSEFLQEQQESINTEASDFRTRQRELLMQRSQPQANPTAPSAEEN